MNYNNIPQEIRDLQQWVTVGYSKKPMQTGIDIPASATKPHTWCSFSRAVQSVTEGERNYIGFVFADNGIVGIDIDAGYDDDGFLTELALDCMTACHSYTERSKSGRGVHILVKGTLPFSGRNNGKGVEIYCKDRFFVTTGDVTIYKDMIENQEAIDYIVEKYFPEMLKTSERKTGPRIYSATYPPIQGNRIPLQPIYPKVSSGGRHQAMLSIGGQVWVQGCSDTEFDEILLELNEKICDPPLPKNEIYTISRSVKKYQR